MKYLSSEVHLQVIQRFDACRLNAGHYNASECLQFELNYSCIQGMKSTFNMKNIDSISRDAMKSQMASFRIEGMNIPKKRADQIRREVVCEFKNGSIPSNS